LVAFAFLFGCSLAISSLGEERRLFAEFMRTYNKQYSSDEFVTRFANFRSNLKEIDARNKLRTGATYNITKFADMSREEFRKYPCGVNKLSDLNHKRPDFTPVMAEAVDLPEAVPVSWDWVSKGAVTPVKDQAQCGSCWPSLLLKILNPNGLLLEMH